MFNTRSRSLPMYLIFKVCSTNYNSFRYCQSWWHLTLLLFGIRWFENIDRPSDYHCTVSGLAFIIQLISNPNFHASELGKGIFGEGNVGFESFEQEHDCNPFCRYFGLDPFVQINSHWQPSKSISLTVEAPSEEVLPESPMTPEELQVHWHEMRLRKGKGREKTSKGSPSQAVRSRTSLNPTPSRRYNTMEDGEIVESLRMD